MVNQTRNDHSEESRRDAIVDAAARIFAEKGFSGSSNRDIAREAGISPGLIYWYFRDKEELFKTVLQRLFPIQPSEMLTDGLDDLPLYELLTLVGQQFIRVVTHPDGLRLLRLGLSELTRFPEVFSEMGPLTGSRVIGPLAGQLDQRVQRGELPPVDTHLVAQAFFGSLIAYVLRKYLYRSADLAETPDEVMVDTVVRIYVGGLSHGAASGQERGQP